jgi:hypothetical protein
MQDKFKNYGETLVSPATNHFAIIPSAEELTVRPRALYVNTSGTLIIEDASGVSEPYEVYAGAILPIRPTKVLLGTTAAVIGWY